MMTFQTTKILGAASGVQYQGVQDNSTGAPRADLSVAVVVGRFKRGLIDRMFAVTKETIRARLGYSPNNPDYQVVQDALDLGVSQVWVRRIRGVIGEGNNPPNTCEGATQSIQILPIDGVFGFWRVFINDDLVTEGGYDDIFGALLFTQGMVWDKEGVLTSYRDDIVQMRLERSDLGALSYNALDNPTVSLNDNVLSFCLRGEPVTQKVLFSNDGLFSEPDSGGFVTFTGRSIGGTTITQPSFVLASALTEPIVQMRIKDMVATRNLHGFFLVTDSFSFQEVAYGDWILEPSGVSLRVFGDLDNSGILAPAPSVGDVLTIRYQATGTIVSYGNSSHSLPYNPIFGQPLDVPYFGRLLTGTILINQGLDEVPMEFKI